MPRHTATAGSDSITLEGGFAAWKDAKLPLVAVAKLLAMSNGSTLIRVSSRPGRGDIAPLRLAFCGEHQYSFDLSGDVAEWLKAAVC